MFIYLLRHGVAVESAGAYQPAHDQPHQREKTVPVAIPEPVHGSDEIGGVKTQTGAKPQPNAVGMQMVSDENRPLTKDGRKKMTNAAHGIDRLISAPIDVILTSPLMRAKETAYITAQVLGAEKKVKLCPELAPGTSYLRLLKALAKYKTRSHIMLVGHAPDLNAAAASLLGSDSLSVELKKGAVCCIEIPTLTGRTKGTLVWLMQPKQLRQLAK